jgi:hypothetical protein
MTSLDTATAPRAPHGETPSPDRTETRLWRRSLTLGAVAYALSRVIVVAAAAAVVSGRRPKPTNAVRPVLDVLSSWDGQWYFSIIRNGYPRHIPPHVTFEVPEARAAFFPLYPMLVRAADVVLPGGDTFAGVFVNLVLGGIFVLLVGILTKRVAGAAAAGRAMVLVSLFPGSFVLLFTYSEAVMLVLAAACLLLLMDRRWVLAGVAAALCTATRPNALAVVAACAVAAFVAIRRERDWWSLAAPILAPLGFIAFQLFLWHQTGERKAWWRVQHEAWGEGISFGWTAIRHTYEFTADPFGSATRSITALCLVATLAGLWALWKAKLPPPVVAYTLVVIALMLLPATVTARPRFLFTAFPIVMAVAMIWPDDDREWWGIALATCAAGLVGVVVLYGSFAAIP